MQTITTIGLDIAKSVFQVHGVDAEGNVVHRRQLKQRYVLAFFSLKRWAALTRFLDDGRLCMTNNAAERELRAIAVGRRNWTFAGSDEGGSHRRALELVWFGHRRRVP